ncbi:MAG: YlbF family regulator [Clostridia bacterium]|nr:YlbF family regulator [Clostridia bacterium]MBQ3870080.1 YlbF family regulator [Clostridia bacterium]
MDKIIEKAAELGELIKETEEMKRLTAATEKYESDAEFLQSIEKYNAFAAGMRAHKDDKEVYAKLEEELGALYDGIMDHPIMKEYAEAKAEADELMEKVYGEITFRITGKRPCNHHCDGCDGCH